MSSKDERPPVWIGHVALYSPAVTESSRFLQQVGMRPIVEGDGFAVLEMRGGTHLVITDDSESSLLRGSFDLMVDDLDATHQRLSDLGLEPGPIDRGRIHDCFEIVEPGGSTILFNSSHASDLPV